MPRSAAVERACHRQNTSQLVGSPRVEGKTEFEQVEEPVIEPGTARPSNWFDVGYPWECSFEEVRNDVVAHVRGRTEV